MGQQFELEVRCIQSGNILFAVEVFSVTAFEINNTSCHPHLIGQRGHTLFIQKPHVYGAVSLVQLRK